MSASVRSRIDGFEIRDVRQIRSLASPFRQDIVDVLAAIGPCTVSELAQHVAKKPDGLYYHLRLLDQVGLIRTVESSGGLDSPGVRVDVVGRPLRIRYVPSNAQNEAAVLAVVRTMIRETLEKFRRAFRAKGTKVKGPARNLWAGRLQGALTPADLLRVNEIIEELVTLLQEREGPSISGKLHEFTFLLAPVVRRRSLDRLWRQKGRADVL